MLSASAAVVMATAVVLAFTVMGGNQAAGGEVFLQPASVAGPDPFTASTVTESQDAAVTPATSGKSENGTRGSDATRALEVNGGDPGLYGGTRNVVSCDVEKQIKFLTQHPAKGKAFAAPLNIRPSDIPSYLRSLTPVRLSWDTRVTNHGYKNEAPTSYQAVLQAGTPVLVDDRGVPRVRCACGNPLGPPVAVKGKQTYSGKEWSSFQSSDLVTVKPAEKPVKTVTMYDQDRKGWYERPSGDVQGKHDHEVPPPKGQTPDSPYPVPPPHHPESVEKPLDEDEVKEHDKHKEPGRDPGKDPGNDPGHSPGKDLGNDPDNDSGQPDKGPVNDPGKDPGRNPGKDPGDDPSRNPGDDPGHNPGNESGKDPGNDPDPGTGKHPGHDPENDPGQKPGHNPGKDPGQSPDKDPGNNPGDNSGNDPGKDPGKDPGNDPDPGTGKDPGKHPGQKPGHNPVNEPGKDPGNNSGQNPGNEPGRVPGQNPGNQPGKDPGNEPGQNSGSGPSKDPGHNPGNGPGKDPGNNSGNNPGQDSGNDPAQNSGNNSGNGPAKEGSPDDPAVGVRGDDAPAPSPRSRRTT
ncbi:DUF6777 domain-containing protein [Streptomyces sp. NPDC054787]